MCVTEWKNAAYPYTWVANLDASTMISHCATEIKEGLSVGGFSWSYKGDNESKKEETSNLIQI